MGDREANLRAAWSELAQVLGTPSISSLYDSDPLYVTDQPRFLNAVVRGTTTRSAHAMLRTALGIEARMGRTRSTPKGPRIIDVDLLLYGDMVIRTEDLIVPHPAIRERAFVLVPLTEMDAGLLDPLTQRPYSFWLQQLTHESSDPDRPAVQRVESTVP